MKELYQVAEMDVINFSLEDVIATSVQTESSFIPPSSDDNTLGELDPLD